jgi:DNA repair protein RecN (Recombination protein N)
MGALDLVLGGRADKSLVRSGAAEAQVEAVFALAAPAAVDAVLAESGLPPCEDGQLIIRRTIAAAGAGRCLLNDAAVTVQTIRRVGALLVDIHGPNDHQSLLDPAFQLDLLDSFGRCQTARAAYDEAWRTVVSLERRRAELLGGAADTASEMDRLQFVIDELAGAHLTPADDADLIREHAEAANAEAILQSGNALLAGLTDGEGSAFDTLAALQHRLLELGRMLPEAEGWRAELQSAATQVQELGRTIAGCLQRIDADPGRLQQLEERMALIQKLRRKYGATVQDMLDTLQKTRNRLDDLAARDERLAGLDAEIATALTARAARAAVLSKARAAASVSLARAITRELRDLGFLRAGFGVDVTPASPRPDGADAVSFGFAPNPGEPMRALRDIASSGEIARVMLAVKTVLARHDRIPVLVFDEIDANIGGEVGHAVGRKLRTVAATHQVLCITHLPQVAVFGDVHFVVSKAVQKNRTLTRISPVTDEARAEEIARMLGGKNLTSVTLEHARKLLETTA